MKNRTCRHCQYIFPIIVLRGVGITFTIGARGCIVQICPQCAAEYDVVVLQPIQSEGVIVTAH